MTDWELPVIASVDDLAARLELDRGQLLWLADRRGLERSAHDERLRNYRYRLLPRSGAMPRVVEIPKGRLKEIQRGILRDILDHVPAADAAHGFVAGRSVITHAALHAGAEMVVTLDLADFFTSLRRPRVDRIFVALGYRTEVARILAGLCTNVVPLEVWSRVETQATDPERADGRRHRLGRLLASPHLPQGAPTSPALANLATFRLDRRLAGLARSHGLTYSRYADDLCFSGPRLAPGPRRGLVALVAEIARDDDLLVNPQKTRTHLAGGRQVVCGVTVNQHPNVARVEYDRLAAILHNAVRDGPAGQNRSGLSDFAAHLRGRIAWVSSVNPSRGARLAEKFRQIDWGAGEESPGD